MRETRTAKTLGLIWLGLLVWAPAATEAQQDCPDDMAPRAIVATPHYDPMMVATITTRSLTPTRSASHSTMPTISATGGPDGIGVFKFDRTRRQYLDGPGLNMYASRGMTVVTIVSFDLLAMTTALMQDILFSFRSSDGMTSFRFIRTRNNGFASVGLEAEHYEDNCIVEFDWDVEAEAWSSILVQLEVTEGARLLLTVNVQGSVYEQYCDVQHPSSAFEIFEVGGSSAARHYMHGHMVGLYAVDRKISSSTVQNIVNSMSEENDVLGQCTNTPCTPGTESTNARGVSPCINCAMGKFQVDSGSVDCTTCAPGTSSSVEGADTDVCETCPAGKTSTAGGLCLCSAGKYAASGGCTDCPENTFSDAVGAADAQACVTCRPFSSSNAGQSSACPCLSGYGDYEVQGARACVACSSGLSTNGGFGECSGCVLRADNCELCGETVVVTAPPRDGCTEYVPGTYTKNEAQHNGFNSYSSADGVTHIYRSGLRWWIGFSVGNNYHLARNTDQSATAPEQGWYLRCGVWTADLMTVVRTVEETTDCYPRCMLGETWHAGDASCAPCAPSYYKDWLGTAPCDRCPSGLDTGGLTGSTSLDACVCPAGSAFIPGNAECQCNAGFADNGTSCTACPAGTYKAAAGGLACDDCPAGKFLGTSGGAGPCGSCPQGTYSLARASNCTLCDANANTAASQSTSAAGCSCNAGFTGDGAACAPCPAGTYKAAAGGLACDDCPAGKFLGTSGGVGPCGGCPQGTYSLARASNCTLCDANANTAASQSTSAAGCSCNQGYTGDGRECTSCAAGKYKDV